MAQRYFFLPYPPTQAEAEVQTLFHVYEYFFLSEGDRSFLIPSMASSTGHVILQLQSIKGV